MSRWGLVAFGAGAQLNQPDRRAWPRQDRGTVELVATGPSRHIGLLDQYTWGDGRLGLPLSAPSQRRLRGWLIVKSAGSAGVPRSTWEGPHRGVFVGARRLASGSCRRQAGFGHGGESSDLVNRGPHPCIWRMKTAVPPLIAGSVRFGRQRRRAPTDDRTRAVTAGIQFRGKPRRNRPGPPAKPGRNYRWRVTACRTPAGLAPAPSQPPRSRS